MRPPSETLDVGRMQIALYQINTESIQPNCGLQYGGGGKVFGCDQRHGALLLCRTEAGRGGEFFERVSGV